MGLRKPRMDLPGTMVSPETAMPPWLSHDTTLLTPLFVGGVVAGKVDSAMPRVY